MDGSSPLNRQNGQPKGKGCPSLPPHGGLSGTSERSSGALSSLIFEYRNQHHLGNWRLRAFLPAGFGRLHPSPRAEFFGTTSPWPLRILQAPVSSRTRFAMRAQGCDNGPTT